MIALNDNEAKSLKTPKGICIVPVICNLIVSIQENDQEHLFIIQSLLKMSEITQPEGTSPYLGVSGEFGISKNQGRCVKMDGRKIM